MFQTWTDYKTNVKKKAAELKRYQEGTGGGPFQNKRKLTDLEERVISILGKTSYVGCGVLEYGVSDLYDNNRNLNLAGEK